MPADSALNEIVRGSSKAEKAGKLAGNLLLQGTVASNPVDVDDPAYVVVPSRSPIHRWGPAPYSPRIEPGGATYAIPSRGDRCLVAFDDEDQPWIIEWWPYDL